MVLPLIIEVSPLFVALVIFAPYPSFKTISETSSLNFIEEV